MHARCDVMEHLQDIAARERRIKYSLGGFLLAVVITTAVWLAFAHYL